MLYPFMPRALDIASARRRRRFGAGLHWYPQEISLFAWERVLEDSNIWRALGNTVFRTVVGTFLTLLVMSMAAYPLSKKYLTTS